MYIAALCLAVWSIYLLDRLLDQPAEGKPVPARKRLGRKQGTLLRILALAAIFSALVFATQLGTSIWIQAGIIAALTALYFLLFRILGKRTRIPAKEILIGSCFAAGIGLPFSWPPDTVKLGGLFLFGTLCTVNCLLISRVEAHFDKQSEMMNRS